MKYLQYNGVKSKIPSYMQQLFNLYDLFEPDHNKNLRLSFEDGVVIQINKTVYHNLRKPLFATIYQNFYIILKNEVPAS